MPGRTETRTRGDAAEQEAARLLQARGWAVENLNTVVRRNYRLHDLRARLGETTILVSVKSAWSRSRTVRLGKPHVFRDLSDNDYIIVLIPKKGQSTISIVAGHYDVWVVPGHARHAAWDAHLHYYGNDLPLALAQDDMKIKDKKDRPGSKSISGAVFHAWEDAYRDAWHLLPS